MTTQPDVRSSQQSEIQGFVALRMFYNALESGRDEVERQAGKSICMDKCGLCCMQNTPTVTELEADYVISLYGAKPSFKEKVARAMEWMETPINGANSRGLKNALQLQHEADIVAHTQCPFLEADMSCGVYDARPTVCRTYGVTLPADEYCPRPLAFFEAPMKRTLIPRDSLFGGQLKESDRMIKKASKGFGKGMVGFLPHWIVRVLARDAYKEGVDHGRVADAKLALGTSEHFDMFKGQESPDEILEGIEKEENHERMAGRFKLSSEL